MPKRRKRRKRTKKGNKLAILKLLLAMAVMSVVVVVLAVSLVVYLHRSGGGDIEILVDFAEEEIVRGVPFDIEVSVINNTAGSIESADVAVGLSEGLVHLGSGAENGLLREDVGDLGSGGLTRKTFTVLPVGSLGSEESVQVDFSYTFSRTLFQESKDVAVVVGGELVDINIETPDQIFGGGSVDLVVNYRNLGGFDLTDAVLELNYPDNFSFQSASMEPDSLNNFWRLGSLLSGSEGSITINGIMEGDSGSFKLKALLSSEFAVDRLYTVADKNVDLNVLDPPIGLDVRMFGVPKVGESIRYVINYTNRSGIDLQNVVITSEIIGELFDLSSVSTDGKINQSSGVVVWDSDTTPSLDLVKSGAGGSVEIEVDFLSELPITRLSDRDFVVKLETKIESPSVPFYLDANRLVAGSILETKVSGQTDVKAKAFYRDAESGVINEGPFPPRVGEATQYVVHWEVVNFSTNVRDVEVRATLPSGVSWLDNIVSVTDGSIFYDGDSDEVFWEIQEISATKGVISDPLKAVFQVEAVPGSDMVDDFQPILGRTHLTAKDNWTGAIINSSSPSLDTTLVHDPTVFGSDGLVLE